MTDINSVVLSGRLGKDAVVKQINVQGTLKNCFGFSICANKDKKDQQGNWTSEGTWMDCVYISNIPTTLLRGDKVIVTGSLSQRTYIDQNGIECKVLRILVDRLEKILIPPKAQPQTQQFQQNQQFQQAQPQQFQQQQFTQQQVKANTPMDEGDTIPF